MYDILNETHNSLKVIIAFWCHQEPFVHLSDRPVKTTIKSWIALQVAVCTAAHLLWKALLRSLKNETFSACLPNNDTNPIFLIRH